MIQKKKVWKVHAVRHKYILFSISQCDSWLKKVGWRNQQRWTYKDKKSYVRLLIIIWFFYFLLEIIVFTARFSWDHCRWGAVRWWLKKAKIESFRRQFSLISTLFLVPLSTIFLLVAFYYSPCCWCWWCFLPFCELVKFLTYLLVIWMILKARIAKRKEVKNKSRWNVDIEGRRNLKSFKKFISFFMVNVTRRKEQEQTTVKWREKSFLKLIFLPPQFIHQIYLLQEHNS